MKWTLLSILKTKIELDTEASINPSIQNSDTLNNESSDPSSGHSGNLFTMYPCIDFKMETSEHGNYVGNCLSRDQNGMNFCYIMKNGAYCPEGTNPSDIFPDKCKNYDVCQKLAKMNTTTVGSLEDTNQIGQYIASHTGYNRVVISI